MACVPIFVNPDVRPFLPAFFVQALEGSIQFGVELAAHEKPATGGWKFRAKTSPPTLHESAHEGRRDGRQFMFGETPVTAHDAKSIRVKRDIICSSGEPAHTQSILTPCVRNAGTRFMSGSTQFSPVG